MVISEGRSLSGNSLANRSSTEDMEEERWRRGEEGGVEQELPPLLTCCGDSESVVETTNKWQKHYKMRNEKTLYFKFLHCVYK